MAHGLLDTLAAQPEWAADSDGGRDKEKARERQPASPQRQSEDRDRGEGRLHKEQAPGERRVAR